MNQLGEHAVRSAFLDLPQASEHRELVVSHSHIRLNVGLIIGQEDRGIRTPHLTGRMFQLWVPILRWGQRPKSYPGLST